MSRWVSSLFWCCAVVLASWGVYLWMVSSVEQIALVVEQPDRELGKCDIGTHEVSFHVSNLDARPWQIVGLSEG